MAKALQNPGGIHYLEKNGEFIPSSEDVVLQTLRRNSLDATKKLDFFHWCSFRPNYKHSVDAYSQVFKILCLRTRQNSDDIFELVFSTRNDGSVLNQSTFKLILDAIISCGKFDSAVEVLDYVERDSNGSSCLSPDTYSSVLVALVSKKQIGIAFVDVPQAFGLILHSWLWHCNSRCYCNIFERMVDDDGVRASCWTYNVLIDGLYRNGRYEAAYTMFCDLKRKGNDIVDGVTYGIVILQLCREDRLEEAFQLVEEMAARGFIIDLVTVTSLLIALYRQGLWDWVERVMKHIRDGNLVPALLSWKSTLEGLLRGPQSKTRDLTPMFPSINDVTEILNCLKCGRYERCGSIGSEDVKILYDENNSWSSSPYMDLLAIWVTSDYHPSQSFSLTRGVRVMARGYLRFSPIWVSTLSSFVKKGYFKAAWGVLHAMGETVSPADLATYNVIIQGLGKMGRADLADAVLNKLTKEGGYLDIVIYNTLINALGKAGRIDDANKLFQQMKTSGINPDVFTYNTLIKVHSKTGRLKDACKFLKLMLDAGCAPNHVTDTILDFLGKEIEKVRYQKASIMRHDAS